MSSYFDTDERRRLGPTRFTPPPQKGAKPVIARDGSVRVSRRAVTTERGELYEGCREERDGTVRCHAGIAERVGAIRVRSTGPVDDATLAIPWWWHDNPNRSLYRSHCYPPDSPYPFRKTRGPDGNYLKAPCTAELWVDNDALDPLDNVIVGVCCNKRMSPPDPAAAPKDARAKRGRGRGKARGKTGRR